MTFKVHDRVAHKHYPGTTGSIVALYGPVVVVLWDRLQAPSSVERHHAYLPQRTSRHIPSALEHVQ